MRVALGPYMQPPQASPPPPSPSKSNNMPILYYALVAVGTAAIVLAIYNFIFIKWGTDNHRRQPWQVMAPAQRVEQGASSQCCSRSFDDPNVNLISSFKYKKEGGGAAASRDQMNEYECAVCLSVFEEGEDVRQLPRCKHSFHTSCIDMWLYSHLDCPLCRSPVEPPVLNRLACPTRPARDSRGGLIDPGIFVL